MEYVPEIKLTNAMKKPFVLSPAGGKEEISAMQKQLIVVMG